MINYEEIPLVPNLPKDIIEAIEEENLAIFIGAGVSRLAGCKGWNHLANSLVNTCYDNSLINFKEKDILLNNSDQKKVITMTFEILKDSDLTEIFYKKMEESLKFNEEPNLENESIYLDLFKMRGLFVTTNADKLFHNMFENENIKYKSSDLTPEGISRNNLYHIHGLISDRDSLVFKVSEYINRYNNPDFFGFLKTIFSEYKVLFIGYGLAEFELLDFIITKFNKDGIRELNHFTLQPYFKEELNIYNYEKKYFEDMGINLIPYRKDLKGYEQLKDIIKKWNEEIKEKTTSQVQTFRKLRYAANNPQKVNKVEIIQYIKNDPPHRKEFFKTLGKTDEPLPWFLILKERGYFTADKNPSPVSDEKGRFKVSKWEVLDYLLNVSESIDDIEGYEIVGHLTEVVDAIIDYSKDMDYRNYYTDWILFNIIFNLPKEKINDKYFEFINDALNSKFYSTLIPNDINEIVLPKLIDNDYTELIYKLFEIILDYKENKEKSSWEKFNSLLDSYYLEQSIAKIKAYDSDELKKKILDLVIDKINQIIAKDSSQFGYIQIPTIEDNPQHSFTDMYQNQLILFLRDILETLDLSIKREKLDYFTKPDTHNVFKRIGIYLININYRELKSYFWNWQGNPLELTRAKHEIYELLKNNCSNFDEEEIELLIDWIESKDYFISDYIKGDEQKIKESIAYRKKEWLLAIKETEDQRVIDLFNEYKSVNSTKISHPGYLTYTESFSGYKSPLDIDEILKTDNVELIEYINQLLLEENNSSNVEGLFFTFTKAIEKEPEKFINDLEEFLELPMHYQKSLISGFISPNFNLENESYINEILRYLTNLIQKFETDSSLFEIGLVTETHLFFQHLFKNKVELSEENCELIENIILDLESNTDFEENEVRNLINVHSIKSSVLSTMIEYSIYSHENSKDKNNGFWFERAKTIFQDHLNDSNSYLELHLVLGKYSLKLFYIDGEWIKDNIDKIFLKDDNELWELAFYNYIFYTPRIDKEFYFTLRQNGNYLKALNVSYNDFHDLDRKVIDHICFSFFNDWESLDESLIKEIIDNDDERYLQLLVNSIKTIFDNKNKSKLKEIWSLIYNELDSRVNTETNNKIKSNLIKWIDLIDEFDDDIYSWLELSVKHLEDNYNVPYFIDKLDELMNNSPEQTARYMITMIKNNDYIGYNEDKIIDTVKKLYEYNYKEEANTICNLFGEKGYIFLEGLFVQNNDLD